MNAVCKAVLQPKALLVEANARNEVWGIGEARSEVVEAGGYFGKSIGKGRRLHESRKTLSQTATNCSGWNRWNCLFHYCNNIDRIRG